MKELTLELTTIQRNDNVIVKVDGNSVNFEKDNTGKLFYNYQTENEKVKIEIFKLLSIGGFFWFITQLFFFLIALFGLLGTYRKEKCLVFDFEIEVDLKEKGTVSLQLNNLIENNKAVNIQTNLSFEEKSNTIVIDKSSKKIIKLLRISKALLAIVIILTVLLLSLKF